MARETVLSRMGRKAKVDQLPIMRSRAVAVSAVSASLPPVR